MMHRRLRSVIIAVVLGGIMAIIVVRVMLGFTATLLAAAPAVNPDPTRRADSEDEESPTISAIDSPSPSCYLPVKGTGACYIQWNYLNVTAASGSYVISMTVTIDDQLRAFHSGFFQNQMFIPSDMTAPGYKVTCGGPSSAETAEWGKTYNYAIRARDTTGLKAANFGSVTCPADVVHIFLPFIRKR